MHLMDEVLSTDTVMPVAKKPQAKYEQLRDIFQALAHKTTAVEKDSRFRFMDLQPEIRLMIYEFLLVAEESLICMWATCKHGHNHGAPDSKALLKRLLCTRFRGLSKHAYDHTRDLQAPDQLKQSWKVFFTRHHFHRHGSFTKLDCGILRVSKSVYNEAARILYAQNTFRFSTAQALLLVLHAPQLARKLQRIRLEDTRAMPKSPRAFYFLTALLVVAKPRVLELGGGAYINMCQFADFDDRLAMDNIELRPDAAAATEALWRRARCHGAVVLRLANTVAPGLVPVAHLEPARALLQHASRHARIIEQRCITRSRLTQADDAARRAGSGWRVSGGL